MVSLEQLLIRDTEYSHSFVGFFWDLGNFSLRLNEVKWIPELRIKYEIYNSFFPEA